MKVLSSHPLAARRALEWCVILLAAPGFMTVRGDTGVYTLIQQDKILTSQASQSDWFGRSMDIDENTVVVGVPLDNDGGTGSEVGSVSVFVWDDEISQWIQEAMLVDSDAGETDIIGWDVAISGDIAVAGALEKDVSTDAGTDEGAIIVWVRTFGGMGVASWSQNQTIFADDAEDGALLGSSVDIYGDWLVAGARNDGENNNTGAVYVFERDAGTFVSRQKLTPTVQMLDELFGTSVAMEEDILVVGTDTGRVIVFKLVTDTWVQDAVLSEGGSSSKFGLAVDIDGGNIVVGAPGANDVYVYGTNYSGTTPTVLSGDAFGSDFGAAVSKKGDFLVVGAPKESSEKGSIYVYNDTTSTGTWTLVQEVNPNDPENEDRFGQAVAVHEKSFLASAFFEDEGGAQAGALYVFVDDPCTDAPSAIPSQQPSQVPSLSPSTPMPSLMPSQLPSAEASSAPSPRPSILPSFLPTTVDQEGCRELYACDKNIFDRFHDRYWMSKGQGEECRQRCIKKRWIEFRKRRDWECGPC